MKVAQFFLFSIIVIWKNDNLKVSNLQVLSNKRILLIELRSRYRQKELREIKTWSDYPLKFKNDKKYKFIIKKGSVILKEGHLHGNI